MNLNLRRNKNKGFTLIELLVVVAIIGLLLSIVSVALSSQRRKAKDARRISDLKQVKSGMDLYYDNGGGYPESAAWVTGVRLLCAGTDIMQIPQDPGVPIYSYSYAASGSSFNGCGTTVYRNYSFTFFIESTGLYYIMNEDGMVREAVSGAPVSLDSLL